MEPKTIKWILFFAMCVTMPVFYFMFVAAGFLPLLAIFIFELMLSVSNGPGTWFMAVIHLLHILIYLPIFYLIALEVSYRLRKFSPSQRKKRVLLIIGCLLLIAGLPIYGAGHGTIDWKNAYQFYSNYHDWLM